MRSRRWALGVGATVLSAVVTVTSGGAAQAVAAFGPVKTIASKCSSAHSQTSSTGMTRGVVGCRTASGSTRLVLFGGTGSGSWSKVSTGVFGTPLAFADDGTSSYVVYQAETSLKVTTVRLLKRNRATGKVTTKKLLSWSGDWSTDAAVVATGGRYWAAVSRTGGSGLARTYTRQTLDPALPTMKPVKGWGPALALRGTKRVSMVVASDLLSSGQTIWRYLPKAGGSWKRTTIRANVGFLPTIQYSGGVTRIAWLEMVNQLGVYKVVYADDASGAFVRRKVPGAAAWNASSPKIVVTGGKLTVAWTGRNSGSPLSWTRTAIAQRVNGTWTSRTVDHGLRRPTLADIGGAGGKVITVMTGPSSTGVSKVTSRRQP